MSQVDIIIHTLQRDIIILHIQHHLMVSTSYKLSPDQPGQEIVCNLTRLLSYLGLLYKKEEMLPDVAVTALHHTL